MWVGGFVFGQREEVIALVLIITAVAVAALPDQIENIYNPRTRLTPFQLIVARISARLK